MLRKESLNMSLLSALVVLASLVLSLVIPTQTKVQAEMLQNNPETVSEDSPQTLQTDYGKMPLLFEANNGQTDKQAKFVSRGAGYTLYLTKTEAVFSLKVESPESRVENQLTNPKTKNLRPKTKSDILRLQFVGANSSPKIEGVDEAVTKTNYYVGKKRFENVPNFQKVNYTNLYDGVDAVFYGNQNNQLEYDFVVAPNADPNAIKLNFDGVETILIDANGNLIVQTANTEIVQQKPFAYQEINGEKREVEVRYLINEQSQISFALGEYDLTKPLVIDPILNYLTYIGGTALDKVSDIAVDTSSNAYIIGDTNSLDFPSSGEREANNATGVYVAKLNATGSQFLYITLLEGNGDDNGFGIAVDANNNAYVAGTASRFFPTTAGAYDTNHGTINEDDAFVTKLDSSGNISYSTFLGGSAEDEAFDIAIDSAGKAYVVGFTFSSTAFPKKNEFQGCGFFIPQSLNSRDAFLTVFNASGSDITYSTCIGGSVVHDEAFSVALDSANNAYITGLAGGDNFPTKNAAQSASGGGTDAWVAKFNPASSGNASLIYSTYLGGSGTDRGFGIAVNSSGTAYVTGVTGSINFPLKNAIDSTNQINEAFVTVYNSSGSQIHSTFLGGSDQDQGNKIALGNGGTIYVTGSTLSNNFPLATPFQQARRGLRDAFVTKLRLGGESPGVSSSSFLGGNGNDFGNGIVVRGAHIFVVGETQSNNLLATSGVIKATSSANSTNPDGFVAKILDSRKDTIGVFNIGFLQFQLKNTLVSGAPDITVNRGAAGDVPIAGDFNGNGIDTVSTFNNGTWTIRNFNVIAGYPTSPTVVTFGQPNDLPVVGDWDGDGIDTLGVYRPSVGQFFLSNTITNPQVNLTITLGLNGDLPVAGDWNGDGIDSIGVFRPAEGRFFLTNQNVLNPPTDITTGQLTFIPEDLPVAGDFNGDGVDSVGIWHTPGVSFFLTNDNTNLLPEISFGSFGDQPVIGDWDGKPNQ